MDPNSLSRPDLCLCKHLHFNLDVLFEKKVVTGSLRLTAINMQAANNQLVLDSNKLHVLSVKDATSEEPLQFELLPTKDPFGSGLVIDLPPSATREGSTVEVDIHYETSPDATALQWLTSSQTVGKSQPYLFTQCQAIHARSMFPCQDTPSVKTTYTAELIVNSSLAIFIQLLDKEYSGCSFWPKTCIGPLWILTATVSVLSLFIAIFSVVDISEYDWNHLRPTTWAAMLLSALSVVLCYVQASVAFFAGHACCYCSWNRASHVEHYQQLQNPLQC